MATWQHDNNIDNSTSTTYATTTSSTWQLNINDICNNNFINLTTYMHVVPIRASSPQRNEQKGSQGIKPSTNWAKGSRASSPHLYWAKRLQGIKPSPILNGLNNLTTQQLNNSTTRQLHNNLTTQQHLTNNLQL
jgi:hypothetical protein